LSLRNPFAEWNRSFALLAGAVFSTGIFFGVQMTLYSNFIVLRLNIQPDELGYVEALREVPGFLSFVFIAAMVHLAPPIVSALALIVMGVGLMAYAKLTSIMMLAAFSLVWSLGFHCWAPLEQTMALTYSTGVDKGRWLGQLRSVHSMAWLLAIGLCMLLFPLIEYEGMFVLAGAVTVAGGIGLLFADRSRPALRERGMVFKRRYWVYYLLQFLQGCRKQIFVTFAVFALVKIHGMPVGTMMVLAMINQVLVFATAPLLGRMVDRYGERRMLALSYAGLACVFVGYALVQHRPSLYVLYCIDNMIFFGGIALTTYVHKIAPEHEVKPTLSMGVTMNHLSAVAAPLAGGLAWLHFGYEVIFLGGAAVALISLVATRWADPERILSLDRQQASQMLEAAS
jgi:predicted MFS family arabinose efflux permease